MNRRSRPSRSAYAGTASPELLAETASIRSKITGAWADRPAGPTVAQAIEEYLGWHALDRVCSPEHCPRLQRRHQWQTLTWTRAIAGPPSISRFPVRQVRVRPTCRRCSVESPEYSRTSATLTYQEIAFASEPTADEDHLRITVYYHRRDDG